MAATYDAIRDLPLTIDGYGLEGHARPFSPEMTRRTTVFRLRGGGEEGVGEDVTYGEEEQLRQLEAGPVLPLDGAWTLASFSDHVGSLDLFAGTPPSLPAYLEYRRWAIESAALDLALRQAGLPLHEAIGREPRPVRFGVSLRLAGSARPLRERIAAYGDVRYKVDYEADWSPELIAELAATGAVDVIDFKGAYKGTVVDVDTVPEIYRRCAEACPDAWLEDPDLTDAEAAEVLAPHRERITWDAPIHKVADLERFGFTPRCCNCKPSRFGALETLFAFYDHCEASGIALYGGGQSELGPGRGQIQLLAALFHPDGPNDVAPSGWDQTDFPRTGLPVSPLDPAPAAAGFRRA
jgi:L-alanine-DL-glutamate epimerase-like enolase superfamily enzyme